VLKNPFYEAEQVREQLPRGRRGGGGTSWAKAGGVEAEAVLLPADGVRHGGPDAAECGAITIEHKRLNVAAA
jgi:hypothetical protein